MGVSSKVPGREVGKGGEGEGREEEEGRSVAKWQVVVCFGRQTSGPNQKQVTSAVG